MSDPFEILSSFTALHQSGAACPCEPDDIMTVLNAAARPRQDGKKSDGIKNHIWEAVKENATAAKQLHRLFKKRVEDYIASAGDVPEKDRQRAAFWANQMVSAWSPTNFFWTNPTAVKRCLDSDGKSLGHGMENWLTDLKDQDFMVKLSDPQAFRLGETLAHTPGRVVLRNELMELIQYEPATPTTHLTPIVFIQPWINKYYIFDLTPENSFVRYLRDRQFTVFITSWKNPGTPMRHMDIENYMFDGALKAIEAVIDICGVKQVHAAGYCIGGTILAALMAWLNRGFVPKRSLPIAHWTLFSSLVDFSNPGELGVFISPKILTTIKSMMRIPGFLDKQYIGMAFRMLRPDSLIWRYHAHNYLMGGKVPESDVLFWNSDNTRLPEKMTLGYLKNFYLDNRLCLADSLQMGGRPIDLGRIGQDLFVVGAQKDHISPWKETFKTCGLVNGRVRYLLSNDGHIAGIVNPPTPHNRHRYRSGMVLKSDDPEKWCQDHPLCNGSWWPDWTQWLSKRCGPLGAPPGLGSKTYPVLGTAPGTYVMET